MNSIRYLFVIICCVGLFSGCESIQQVKPDPSPQTVPNNPTPSPSPKPAPPPPRPVPNPVPEPALQKISIATDVLFEFNQATLGAQSKSRLDELARDLRGATFEVVLITGHADSQEVNPKLLSRKRADEVKKYLTMHGLDMVRLYSTEKGNAQPIRRPAECQSSHRNSVIACLQPNRRVEVEVSAFRGSQSTVPLVQERLIPVMYATNRKKTGSNDAKYYFADEEAEDSKGQAFLTMGRALVSVPPVHTKGMFEQPGWVRVSLEKTPLEIKKVVGLGKFNSNDPLKHFSFARPIEELTEADFKSDLQKSIMSSKSKSALLYVHGYANSFAVAAFRTAQLTFDLRNDNLDVVPIMYSWPSDPGGVNYVGAKDQIRSSGEQLAVFLDRVADIAGVGVVHIIAHSMGAEVLATALEKMGTHKLTVTKVNGTKAPKFNQIVLAAPDIRAKDFGKIILPAITSGHRVTNYASSNDTALRLSRHANAGARAGDTVNGLVPVLGVETVDASGVNDELLGHSFFAESPRMIHDLGELLRVGAKPSVRGLEPVKKNAWTYWLFKP